MSVYVSLVYGVYAGWLYPAGPVSLVSPCASFSPRCCDTCVTPQVHAVIGVNPTKEYPVTPAARQQLLEGMLREGGGWGERVRVVTTLSLIHI
eukprot:3300468-Pyramimonas_sp.AAC.1